MWFRKGDLKQAAEYLYAAWTLRQDPIIGSHLAQVYEKQQRKQEATHMYRFVAAGNLYGRGTEDLEAIADAKKQLAGQPAEPPRKAGNLMLSSTPGEELSKDRTASLPKLVTDPATAEFFLTFAPATNAAAPQARSLVGRGAIVEDANRLGSSAFGRRCPSQVSFQDGFSAGRFSAAGASRHPCLLPTQRLHHYADPGQRCEKCRLKIFPFFVKR